MGDLDYRLLKWIVETFRSDALTPVMVFVTDLNRNPIFFLACAVAYAAYVWRLPPERRRRAVYFLGLLAATIAAADLLEARVLKPAAGRLRPFLAHDDIRNLVGAGKLSFPSGHATNAFAAATILSLCLQARGFAIPAFLFAGVVGFSRLYLGVHYPGDVLAGACLGTGVAYGVWRARVLVEARIPAVRERTG